MPLANARQAEIVCNTLAVDTEPTRGALIKNLITKGNVLQVSMSATELRKLRVGVNSFMDHLLLTLQTIEKFDPKTSV